MLKPASGRAALLVTLSLTAGCGVEPGADETQPSDQAIYGGGLVPRNTGPYGSTIKIIFPFSTSEQCSGVKVGATRFYTAAHCTQGWVPTTTLFISNAVDPGDASPTNPNWTQVSLKNVFVHPSYAADPIKFTKVSTEKSYDVAIIDLNEQTSAIPVAGVRKTHIPDSFAFYSVGYGKNVVFPAKDGRKQTAGYFATVASVDDDRHTHQIVGDGGTEGLGGGDSGGPAFSVDTNEVIGLGQNSDAPSTPTTLTRAILSGFARIANVSRWLDSPHNGSLTTISGIGFLQQRATQKCAVGGSLAVGQPVPIGQCEGYDPNIHAQLWNAVPIGRTSAFQIKAAKPGTNLCFDLSGSDVVLQTCNASRLEQQWVANRIGTDGLFYFVVNQKDPANGVLSDRTGHVSLRVGSSTLGQQTNWMFYR